MNKKIIFLIFICLSFFILHAHPFANSVDSLQTKLNTIESKSGKAQLQYQIAEACFLQNNSGEAIEYLTPALEYNQKQKDTLSLARCNNLYGEIYASIEEFALSNQYYKTSLSYYSMLDSTDQMAKIYGAIGVNFYYLGSYEKTIENYLKSLNIYENLKDSVGISKSLNNIGTVHIVQKNFDLAEDYFVKALKLNRLLKRKNIIAQNINNLGILNKKKGDFEKALEYYQVALELDSEMGDSVGIARDYNNIANIHLKRSENDKALNFYKKSLQIKMRMKNQRSVAQSLGNMANLYLGFAEEEKRLEKKQDYIYTAIDYANQSLAISEKLELIEEKFYVYGDLQDAYQKLGDYKKAFYFQNKYLEVLNALNNKDKRELSRNIEAKYQFSKKTQEIERQKFELQKAENDAQKQQILAAQEKNLRNFFIITFLLMTILATYIYYHFVQKRKANHKLEIIQSEITEKNEELNQQNEEILAQRDEIESKKDLLESQKEFLENMHGQLTKSIDYAERIQSSLLSNPAILKDYIDDIFIFYRPRDVVSGDFYWWNHIEGHTVIAVGDSTGHGVPGAFMSTLGISFLREIVLKEYITHPGVILRRLRKEIIHSLKQTGATGEQKDGMDMAIISINHETKTMQFAGANNPIYVVSNALGLKETDWMKVLETDQDSESDSKQNHLFEIRPDKMPIAIYDKMDRFNLREIQLQKGDQIYLFTDGFADQFGGSSSLGKKFKYKPFKKLLLENAQLSMSEQKSILVKSFDQWKDQHDQVDDVLVLGIKV